MSTMPAQRPSIGRRKALLDKPAVAPRAPEEGIRCKLRFLCLQILSAITAAFGGFSVFPYFQFTLPMNLIEQVAPELSFDAITRY